MKENHGSVSGSILFKEKKKALTRYLSQQQRGSLRRCLAGERKKGKKN